LCSPDEIRGVAADRSADLDELSHIETPLAQLVFRDEGLALPDALAKFDLGETGVFPRLHQQRDEASIEV
jgi:hypothetical protein